MADRTWKDDQREREAHKRFLENKKMIEEKGNFLIFTNKKFFFLDLKHPLEKLKWMYNQNSGKYTISFVDINRLPQPQPKSI